MELVIAFIFENIGRIPISKAVAPVLGIANKGPIDNTTIDEIFY